MTCYLVPCRTNFVCDTMGSTLIYNDCLAQYHQEMNTHRLLDCPPVPFALRQPLRTTTKELGIKKGRHGNRHISPVCSVSNCSPSFSAHRQVLSIFLLYLSLSVWGVILSIFGVFYPLSLPDNAI